MSPVGDVRHCEVEGKEQADQRPLRADDEGARNLRQGRDRQTSDGDAEHEHGHHHRERELGRAEGQRAEAIQGGLEGHHAEARQQRDAGPRGEAWHWLGRGTRHEIWCNARGADIEPREDRGRQQIEATHQRHDAVQTQPWYQEEPRGERACEGTDRVGAVDPGVNTRCVFQITREGQREDGNRSAHQDTGRTDQQRRQRDVERESVRVVVDRDE